MESRSSIWTFLATIAVPIVVTSTYIIYKRYRDNKNAEANGRLRRIRKNDRSFVIVEEKGNIGSLDESDRESHATSAWNSLGLEQPLVIAMVGLPARGKSYIVKMIIRYLNWIGYECDVFNVGSYRRKVGLAAADAAFFDNSNPEAQQMREKLAMAVLDMMYSWLQEVDGSKRRVAIFDATNTTRSRRSKLIQRARRENVFLLFVESICDNKQVLERNYRLKLKNDDYKDMDPKQALQDFIERVHAYEQVYEVTCESTRRIYEG